jgi:cyanophycinase
VTGVLALVGGDEFHPGNEPQDRALIAAAGSGPAFVVPTAAARQGPEKAVATAQDWFRHLGLALQELRVLTRTDAQSKSTAERASEGGLFYLVGGDPGYVVKVLEGSRVWSAIEDAWRRGAALAGSSAGAMALGAASLIRARWPNREPRRPLSALGVVPGISVLPHYETFGHRWVESAREADPDLTLVGIDERTAAFWDGSVWRVEGPGTVTVINGDDRTLSVAGEVIARLPRPGG